MIAGEGEAGKSLLALWHAIRWSLSSELLGLYFSADSAELGQGARALAMMDHTGTLTVAEAEKALVEKDEYALAQMDRLYRLSWSFENDLSYENIWEECEAFIELWGAAPDYVVIDNLTDVEGQGEDEWGNKRRALKALVQLARLLDTAVVVLDHTSEGARYDVCPPRSAILGKNLAKPALVLTTANRGSKRPVARVKDRYGSGADKSGNTAVWLRLDQDTLHYAEGV